MEAGFMTALKEEEKNAFVKYSESIRDLASFFKVANVKTPISKSHATISAS